MFPVVKEDPKGVKVGLIEQIALPQCLRLHFAISLSFGVLFMSGVVSMWLRVLGGSGGSRKGSGSLEVVYPCSKRPVALWNCCSVALCCTPVSSLNLGSIKQFGPPSSAFPL